MVTGFPGASPASAERGQVLQTLRRLLQGLDYVVTEMPEQAGTTMSCSYRNSLGSPDRIKIDLDLPNRMTLLPSISRVGPALFAADDLSFPVVSEPELLGQKLTAVAYRAAPRDLFDMDLMLNARWQGNPSARAMYLAYSFLQDKEWYRLSYPVQLKVPYKPAQLRDVLRGEESAPSLASIRETAKRALDGADPPFTTATDREQAFRQAVLAGDRRAFSDIAGQHDRARRAVLATHPGLAWRLQQAGRPSARKPSRRPTLGGNDLLEG